MIKGTNSIQIHSITQTDTILHITSSTFTETATDCQDVVQMYTHPVKGIDI